MLPSKIQRGESFSRLFDLWNQLIDYLHETRLVAGSGISISKQSAGTVIHAARQPSVSGSTAAGGTDNYGPFDVENINKGTVGRPDWRVIVHNSFDEYNTGIAGYVTIGSRLIQIEDKIFDNSSMFVHGNYIYMDVIYDPDEGFSAELRSAENIGLQVDDRECIIPIAYCYGPGGTAKWNITMHRRCDNIEITGRWL